VCADHQTVSLAFIGIEQVMSTFPERSPACFNTSLTRDQWTARSSTSASSVPGAALPLRGGRLDGEPVQLRWLRA
jgi:hypothetical protein